LNLLKLLLY